jgi:Tol biopolymer transport system component
LSARIHRSVTKNMMTLITTRLIATSNHSVTIKAITTAASDVQPSHQNIFRMPASGGPLQRVTNFPEAGLFLEEPTISPDGRWLLYSRSNGGSSLWLLRIESSQSTVR